MKLIALFSAIFLIALIACKKETILDAPKLPYVNLKYPAIGQISKYKHYQKLSGNDYCENTYTGDTMILEIFDETTEGFLLRRYLSDFSVSQFDPTGVFFEQKSDTLLTELRLQNDTAFIINPPGVFDYIFVFDKIPLHAPSVLIEELLPCTPVIFSVPEMVAGEITVSSMNHFSLNEHIYNNATSMGIYVIGFHAIQSKEVNLSTYHQILSSVTLNHILPGQNARGFELVVED